MQRTTPTKLICNFLQYYQTVKLASVYTIQAYQADILEFAEFMKDKFPARINRMDIRAFLFGLQTKGFKVSTIRRKIASLKSFYHYLVIFSLISSNPFIGITGPRKVYLLPKFLSQIEISKLLEQPNLRTLAGKRDQAIMETIYTAGLRLSELTNLRICDMDFNQCLMTILGKRQRERILPIGICARNAVLVYLRAGPYSKPFSTWIKKSQEYIFKNLHSQHITNRSVERIIEKYLIEIGHPELSAHSLRHSFATHMLERGCDIRTIQEFLGHQNTSSTQVYTHCNLKLLKSSYKVLEDLRESMNQIKLFTEREMVGA